MSGQTARSRFNQKPLTPEALVVLALTVLVAAGTLSVMKSRFVRTASRAKQTIQGDVKASWYVC